MRALWRRRWGTLLLLGADALVLALYFLLRSHRTAMNAVARVTVYYRRAVGALCALVPFSVTELVYAAAVFGAVFVVARALRCRAFADGALTLASAALTLYTAFCLLWGVNYRADGVCEAMGLADEPVRIEALYAVTQRFAALVAETAPDTPRAADGTLDVSADEILALGETAYDALSARYPFLALRGDRPKAMAFSRVMSAMGYTGLYLPFTGETNVNVDVPPCVIPFTVAHELSHRRGFAREDECNFLGVLASLSCESAVYRYSGALMGYIYLSNALYSADPALWREVYAALPAEAIADLDANNAYWARYEGPVSGASDRVYDALLRSCGEEQGTRSYGAAVDLLVAYYYE